MSKQRTALSTFVLLTIALTIVSCSLVQPQQQITYDPNKTYATFLVVDTDAGKMQLERMKQHTLQESMEIGQIEYYQQGTTDFLPIMTKLTASPQVKVVWIISMVLDVPQIKTAMAKITYTGAYRYAPIMNDKPVQVNQ